MSEPQATKSPIKSQSIFRARAWLRFLPRRAIFHRYPLIGRFASFARSRAYLWAFRSPQLRPAFYLGAVLSLWPVMGIQIPLALALCVLARANFMVVGALQLITNPLTAAPIYYGTYRLGKTVLQWLHWQPATVITQLDAFNTSGASTPLPAAPEFSWAASTSSTVVALVIGGTLAGLILGAGLDAAYCYIGAARRRNQLKVHP